MWGKLEEMITADYYKPKMNVVYDQYNFFSRNLKAKETICDFVKEIKTSAHTSEFQSVCLTLCDVTLRNTCIFDTHYFELAFTSYIIIYEAPVSTHLVEYL